MASSRHVYCPACLHRGKSHASGELGTCTRCGTPRVLGVPTTGAPAGRPRKTVAAKLREQAAALVALADELDAS